MRGINNRFINDLKTGSLEFFLNEAKNNPSICLEIRSAYINLYYKGGNALKIEQRSKDYTFHFDSKYCLNKDDDRNFQKLNNIDKRDCHSFQEAFYLILSEMDRWLERHPKPEREFQHNLIKSNQRNPVILDIEYAGRTSDKRLFRLDMLGVYKTDNGYKAIVFENKYGNGAISGSAGIRKHYLDIVDILSNKSSKEDLIGSIVKIANNKTELGLIDLKITEEVIHDVEILFLMAGFNMRSKSISNEVSNIERPIPARICFMNPDEMVLDYTSTKDLFTYEYLRKN